MPDISAGKIYAQLEMQKGNWFSELSKANQAAEASEKFMQKRFGAIRKHADTAANGFLALGTVAAIGLGAMAKAAMGAIESENLFTVALGKNAGAVKAWSQELRKSLGLNEYELRKNVGMFYTMFDSMGIGETAALGMSKGITQLAYDMASFYNLKPDEAFQKLQSGISGEIEPLKRLGIMVDETTLKTFALKQGIEKKTTAMTQAEKAELRYQLILAQTSKAQGDLARTIDSPTNKLRVMSENAKQLAVDFGTALLPVVDRFLSAGTRLAATIGDMTDEQKKSAAQFALYATGAALLVGGTIKASLAVSQLAVNLKALNFAFTGLSRGGLIGLVAAIGAGAAAWLIYKNAMDAPYRELDRQIRATKDLTMAKETEIKQLEATKSKRQADAEELRKLSDMYATLSSNTNRTAAETGKLQSVKKSLTGRMAEIRTELGLQAKSWDGTTGSINNAISALTDFTKIERDSMLASAQLRALQLQEDTLTARKRREQAETRVQNVTTFMDPNRATNPFTGPLERYIATRPDVQKKMAADLEAAKRELALARAEENSSFHQMRQQQEISERMSGMTLEQMKKMGGGDTGTVPMPTITGGATTKDAKRKKTAEEIHRESVQRLEDALQLAQAEAKLAIATGDVAEAMMRTSLVKIEEWSLRNQLQAGITKYGESSAIGMENQQRLVALDQEIADRMNANAAALADAFGANLQDGIEDRKTQQALKDAVIQAMLDRAAADASILAESMGAGLQEGIENKKAQDALRDAIIQAELDRAAADAKVLAESMGAGLQEALENDKAKRALQDAIIQAMLDQAVILADSFGAGLQDSAGQRAAKDQAGLDIADANERATQAGMALDVERLELEAARTGTLQDQLAALDAQAQLLRLQLAEAELLLRFSENDLDQQNKVKELKNELYALDTKRIGVLKEGQLFNFDDFGKVLWDSARDKDAVNNYFDNLLGQIAAKGFDDLWKRMTTGSVVYDEQGNAVKMPGALDQVLGKIPGLKGMSAEKVLGAVGGIMGGVQGIEQGGMMGGAMGGMSIANSLSAIPGLSGLGGPWGMVAGAVLGGILGGDSERKRREEQANAVREAQLAELRRLNANIKPVSDFYNRGAFGAFSPASTFGGASATASSWAIQSARGLTT